MGLGLRNPNCRFYDVCLSKAAGDNNLLRCHGCFLWNDGSYEMSDHDRFRLLCLHAAAYHPEAYKEFRRWERGGDE